MDAVLCHCCFEDEGLRILAERSGTEDDSVCPTCKNRNGRKLTMEQGRAVAYDFFVRGTTQRCQFGAAPLVQINDARDTDITVVDWLQRDVARLSTVLKVGLFTYGPRLWMVGLNIDPLDKLLEPESRDAAIARILEAYPVFELTAALPFYRVRRNPQRPNDPAEYDTPDPQPPSRLTKEGSSALYGSPDMAVCLHECRVTAEDETFAALLVPSRTLRLLDLTVVLEEEEGTSEFESLDLAVLMIFLAGNHAYEIAQQIAKAVSDRGFDGVLYPSYFSSLRTGGMPFETSFGISHRRFRGSAQSERAKIVPNVAIFGKPVADGRLLVKCINRVIIKRVDYELGFGPASVNQES